MKKTFPHHPATFELYPDDGSTVEMELVKNFTWEEEPGPNYAYFTERDVGDAFRTTTLAKVTQDLPGFFEGFTPAGSKVIVRAYDEYDPVRIGWSAIPLPKSVAQDVMSGEDDMTLSALVDDNGDVATLMLDSATSSHVRFTGQWFLLPDIEAISDYDIVGVEDTAVDVFDPADQAGHSVKITSMPVKVEEDFRVQARYNSDQGAQDMQPLLTESITAGGALTIPVIATARDLPQAINFALQYPEFRWFVERRAKALQEDMTFPW